MLAARVINSGLRGRSPPPRRFAPHTLLSSATDPRPSILHRLLLLLLLVVSTSSLPMPPLYSRYIPPRNLPPRLPIYAAQRCAMSFTGENMKTPLCGEPGSCCFLWEPNSLLAPLLLSLATVLLAVYIFSLSLSLREHATSRIRVCMDLSYIFRVVPKSSTIHPLLLLLSPSLCSVATIPPRFLIRC